jgi:hypothetical protein
MIPVHEHQGLLAQNDEERVHEFGNLRTDPQERPITGERIFVNFVDVRVGVLNGKEGKISKDFLKTYAKSHGLE